MVKKVSCEKFLVSHIGKLADVGSILRWHFRRRKLVPKAAFHIVFGVQRRARYRARKSPD